MYANLNDLQYFETNITKGKHIINVEYTAERWIDKWDWVSK